MDYPSPLVWTDTQIENITFPHPSDAGGKYRYGGGTPIQSQMVRYHHPVPDGDYPFQPYMGVPPSKSG